MKRSTLAVLVLGALALGASGLWLRGRSGPDPVRPAYLEAIDPLVRECLEEGIQGVQRRRGSHEARVLLGMAYEANGLYGEAAYTYEQALALRPGDSKTLYRLAHAQERSGDLALAARTLADAAEAAPSYSASWLQLASWRLELGETEGAAVALERARATEPGDPSIPFVEVRLALARREAAEAVALLEDNDLLEGAQQSYAQHLLALALRQQGDFEGAERASAQAKGEPPTLDDPWTAEMRRWETGYASLRLRAGRDVAAGRFAEAKERLRQVLAHDPDDAESRNILGVCLLEQGDAVGALAEIERALALDPAQFEAAANHARALLRRGRATPEELQSSYERLRRALAARPAEGSAWRILAALAKALGRAADYRSALEHALELDPSASELRIAIGYAALESGDLDGALGHFRHLQVEVPSETEAWFGEATALALGKRTDEAHAVLETLEGREDASPERLGRLRELLRR